MGLVVDRAEDWVLPTTLRDGGSVERLRGDGDEVVDLTEPFPVTFRPTHLLARVR